jgi:hypothetical protein
VVVARKVQVLLTDDLDGSGADETVQFGLDGVFYEIDLSGANAEALREVFAAYVDAARRVGDPIAQRARAAAARVDLHDLRAWARANGYRISDRGRVSSEVREAYDIALLTGLLTPGSSKP